MPNLQVPRYVLRSVLNQGPFPPPALPGFSGTTSLSATPERPAFPSPESGWSSPTTPRGFPCCARFPCVHAAATTPAQRLAVLPCSSIQSCQTSPIRQSGRPAHLAFRGLLSVHSRCGLHTRAATHSWHAYPKASDISSPPCLLRLLPAGAVAGWGLHPLESAAFSRRTSEAPVRFAASNGCKPSEADRRRHQIDCSHRPTFAELVRIDLPTPANVPPGRRDPGRPCYASPSPPKQARSLQRRQTKANKARANPSLPRHLRHRVVLTNTRQCRPYPCADNLPPRRACRGALSRPHKSLAPTALLVRIRRSDNCVPLHRWMLSPPQLARRASFTVLLLSAPECAVVRPSGLASCGVACTLAFIAYLDFNMAWEHITLVRQVPLQYIAKLILFALASRVDDEGKCWPSIDTICHDTGLKHRTTQIHLKSLVENGYVIRQERPGRTALLWINMRMLATGVSGTPPHDLHTGSACAARIRCRTCTRSRNRTTNKSPITKVIHKRQPNSPQQCTDNVVGNPCRDRREGPRTPSASPSG